MAQTGTPTNPFTSVAAGGISSCALRVDGRMTCWGGIADGSSAPAHPPGRYRSVVAGDTGVCALTQPGRVICWDPAYTYLKDVPPHRYTEVALGPTRACGIKSNGGVTCWPGDVNGEKPPRGSFKKVAVGAAHACAIASDGHVICWGTNAQGQRRAPRGRFGQIVAGSDHTCGLRRDGRVRCWGANDVGQSRPPAGRFTQLSASPENTCGIRRRGPAVCWGELDYVVPAGRYRQIAAGRFHTCAVTRAAAVACWSADEANLLPADALDTGWRAGDFVPVRCQQLTAPATVTPKQNVTLIETGLRPGATVRVSMNDPNGDALPSTRYLRPAVVAGNGTLTVNFVWPARNQLDFGDGHPNRFPWTDGQQEFLRVDAVQPSSTGVSCGNAVVIVHSGT